MKPIFTPLSRALLFGAILPITVSGQTIVTTLVDEDDGNLVATNGDGTSLREAINHSSQDLTFAADLDAQTITLTLGQLVIDRDVQIDASNLPNGLSIDANQQSRIFEVQPNATVALNGLSLTGGNAAGTTFPANSGGAIFSNNATLSLNTCNLSRNSASEGGGIFSNGFAGSATLSLSNCTLAGNTAASFGGGIFNEGSSNGSATLTLSNCTLSDNSAALGGSILSNGNSGSTSLSLNTCTLSGNSANLRGGGIFNNGFAGNATLNLTNCTLSENSASSGGGIFSDDSNSGSVTLRLINTILASNIASTGSDLEDSNNTSTIFPSGSNLLSNTDGHSLTNNTQGINIIAPTALNLAPLGDYGGPTQTMHPLAGSAAIITGIINRTDQRGFTLTGPTTIGAVQLGSITEVSNEETLRAALTNSVGAGDIIRFANSLNGETLTLTEGQLTAPSTVNGLFIDASSLSDSLTIDANQQSRIIELQPNATVALHGLTLTGGNATGSTFPANSGGAIFSNNATLSLSACTLSENFANSGGGIFSDGFDGSATLTLSACTLSGNSAASLSGGGIFSDGSNTGNATLTLRACTLSGNSAAIFGGGILSNGFEGSAILSLSACTLSGNSATNLGGGIFSDGFAGSATLSLSNTILASNIASNGPDLEEMNNTTIISPTGSNLLSSTDGHSLTNTLGIAIIAPSDLNLAPLGNYGGPTQTRPPLPNSPAIDAGGSISPNSTDQRGFPRVFGAGLDIGAVEFQDETEETFNGFQADSDSDGSSNGVELAIGTDPFVADASDERNLRLGIQANGNLGFNLGFDTEQQDNIILRLTRSTDLTSFDTVVIGNESSDFSLLSGNLLTFFDNSPPADGRAFYRLEAELR